MLRIGPDGRSAGRAIGREKRAGKPDGRLHGTDDRTGDRTIDRTVGRECAELVSNQTVELVEALYPYVLHRFPGSLENSVEVIIEVAQYIRQTNDYFLAEAWQDKELRGKRLAHAQILLVVVQGQRGTGLI